MQSYTAHTQYFETLCRKTKIFSHGRTDAGTGDERKTFFRLNDEEEALNGQVSGMHFPCLIHNTYSIKGLDKGGSERLVIGNSLWVLAKPEDTTPDAIEAAYTLAETALQKLISRMLKDAEDRCSGPFWNIDMGSFTWEAMGEELAGLYGYTLTIREEQLATELTTYNQDDYYS